MHHGGTYENGVSSGAEQMLRFCFLFFFLSRERQTGRGGENETCLEIERITDRGIRNESGRSERWAFFFFQFLFYFFRWMWEVNDLRSLQNLNYLLAFLQPLNCQLMATETRCLLRPNAPICTGLFAFEWEKNAIYAVASL